MTQKPDDKRVQPLRQKKVPVRRCVGCGEGKPKGELVRVVRTAAGDISVDLTGKKAGRGAYVCKDAACLKLAQKKRALERAFSCKMPDELYERLAGQLAGGPEDG